MEASLSIQWPAWLPSLAIDGRNRQSQFGGGGAEQIGSIDLPREFTQIECLIELSPAVHLRQQPFGMAQPGKVGGVAA
ncbi:MAG TPA: hypothetical protein PK724_01010, partial [Pseudomonadales bacterium]|nr:hypothetical protein [Pseudomonadales bacterium]